MQKRGAVTGMEPARLRNRCAILGQPAHSFRALLAPMTLHFAYGSNMSRSHMATRCPQARALGTATLAGWRFVIGRDGYASLLRERGARVHGVLWRLTPRDLAALNAYENIAGGLYVVRTLPVRRPAPPSREKGALHGCGRPSAALVYIARRRGTGTPRPGYLELVLAAAREWKLPQPHMRALARWSPSRWHGALSTDTGEAA
jgi:hypothetical protein